MFGSCWINKWGRFGARVEKAQEGKEETSFAKSSGVTAFWFFCGLELELDRSWGSPLSRASVRITD